MISCDDRHSPYGGVLFAVFGHILGKPWNDTGVSAYTFM